MNSRRETFFWMLCSVWVSAPQGRLIAAQDASPGKQCKMKHQAPQGRLNSTFRNVLYTNRENAVSNRKKPDGRRLLRRTAHEQA